MSKNLKEYTDEELKALIWLLMCDIKETQNRKAARKAKKKAFNTPRIKRVRKPSED